MKHFPQNVSEAVRKRNPHLYPVNCIPVQPDKIPKAGPACKLRQSKRPLLNKLETEFAAILRRDSPDDWLVAQGITFRLANGVRYTPDFVTISGLNFEVNAYEVKGFMRDDAGVKLKLAAQAFPWIRWTLVWKQNGEWKRQVVVA